MLDTPRSCTWVPPPGAPEFCVMIAPAILPWSALSTVGADTRVSCSAETTETAFAAFRLETAVDVPVTTCASSWSTSFTSVTRMSFCPAGTVRLRCWYPMRRTRSVTVVDGARMLNWPASFVYVPVVAPMIVTDADGSGAPPSTAATRPVIRRCCASAMLALSKPMAVYTRVRIFTAPPIVGDRAVTRRDAEVGRLVLPRRSRATSEAGALVVTAMKKTSTDPGRFVDVSEMTLE